MWRLERLELATWSESEWARCYALHTCAHGEQGTTARSLDAYRSSQLAAAKAGVRSWIVREGDAVIGKVDLTQGSSPPGLALLNLYVHPQARQRGVARTLVVAALREAQHAGAQLLEAVVMRPDVWRLCERFGGRFERGGALFTLQLANASWELVDAWSRGPQRSPQTCLQEIEQLPDALASAFLELHKRAWSDQPHAEHAGQPLTLDDRRAQEHSYERLGWRWITLVSREPSGVLSGMTDILYDPGERELVRQNFTGVLPDYRGRGLAKWLKASMLQLVRDRFPAALRISTTNADTTAPMRGINQKLGFNAPIHHRTYRFDLTQLCDALQPLAASTSAYRRAGD